MVICCCIGLYRDVTNPDIRNEIEQAIEGVEVTCEDSDTALEDEIIESQGEDISLILHTKDDDAVIQTPGQGKNKNIAFMSPEQEQVYLEQLKQDWEGKYKDKISQKNERLNNLKKVVTEQDDLIANMRKKLKTIGEQHEKEYQENIKKMKKYMKEWAKNVMQTVNSQRTSSKQSKTFRQQQQQHRHKASKQHSEIKENEEESDYEEEEGEYEEEESEYEDESEEER